MKKFILALAVVVIPIIFMVGCTKAVATAPSLPLNTATATAVSTADTTTATETATVDLTTVLTPIVPTATSTVTSTDVSTAVATFTPVTQVYVRAIVEDAGNVAVVDSISLSLTSGAYNFTQTIPTIFDSTFNAWSNDSLTIAMTCFDGRPVRVRIIASSEPTDLTNTASTAYMFPLFDITGVSCNVPIPFSYGY